MFCQLIIIWLGGKEIHKVKTSALILAVLASLLSLRVLGLNSSILIVDYLARLLFPQTKVLSL